MIKIENVRLYGWPAAVRCVRNYENTDRESDSNYVHPEPEYRPSAAIFKLGQNDFNLMKTLIVSGNGHSKFLQMINVTADINAPLYWWNEYDTCDADTVTNTGSILHKLQTKEFTIDDFSHEHLFNEYDVANENWRSEWLEDLHVTIERLNCARQCLLDYKDEKYWQLIIQLLPASYNQHRTVQFNYVALKNMYQSHRYHRLSEWRKFCQWVKSLLYGELITG